MQLLRILCAILFMLSVTDVPAAAADRDSDVLSVLQVNDQLTAEMLKANASAVQAMLSDQFIASDPSNTVRNKDDLVAVVASGRLQYDSFEVEIDAAQRLGGGLVVLMGVETSTQSAVPADGELKRTATSKALKRRFTNVYRQEEGVWRLLVKQSTVIAVE